MFQQNIIQQNFFFYFTLTLFFFFTLPCLFSSSKKLLCNILKSFLSPFLPFPSQHPSHQIILFFLPPILNLLFLSCLSSHLFSTFPRYSLCPPLIFSRNPKFFSPFCTLIFSFATPFSPCSPSCFILAPNTSNTYLAIFPALFSLFPPTPRFLPHIPLPSISIK